MVIESRPKEHETKKGWSDVAIFMELVRELFVSEVHPKQNENGYVVLIVDGSKTDITVSNIAQCKELGVQTVVVSAYLTDVIQPLDRTLFGALKRAFMRLGREPQRECKGRAANPASFVELWTKACVEAVPHQNMLSAFKSRRISPFDAALFLQHFPPAQ